MTAAAAVELEPGVRLLLLPGATLLLAGVIMLLTTASLPLAL
jgi:hypothetical protein